MYRINPGEFKHPIKIIITVEGTDIDGNPKNISQSLLETRAKIKNISGKETILSDGITSSEVKRFYIRYKNVNINTDCKLKYNNKTYNITYVSDIEEKHKYFEIVAEV